MDFETIFANKLMLALFIVLPLLVLVVWYWLRQRRLTEQDVAELDLYSDDYFENQEFIDELPSRARLVKQDLKALDDFAEADAAHASKFQDVSFAPEPARVAGASSAALASTTDELEAETLPPETSPQKSPLIVALFIHAKAGQKFAGEDIFAAMNRIGLQFGKMDIFHHYGLEQASEANEASVFSVANLVEPGTFDAINPESFSTPGLVVFMQLPGPLDGRVAFELMLDHAQRLADILQGSLEDDRRQPLDAESIEFFRQGIDDFERS